jgi:2-methylcitrate dehydratase PrpD
VHAQTAEGVARLGAWVAGLQWGDLPVDVQERHELIWADYLTVACAGAQLPEYQALLAAWPLADGPVVVPGTTTTTVAELAAWVIGTVGVALEQDEGNKFAKGHPAAHVLPAVLALGISRGATGQECALAVAAGYEVAARFGRASSLTGGVHPHGNWGVAAAAAGCAKLLGLDGAGVAAAIDHASGMGIAGHFSSALDGNVVRNSWMGAAQVSGIASAYLAAAGSAMNTGTAAPVYGQVLGTWEPSSLVEKLGERWDARSNYFKVHAACAFTHPPIDAVLALVEQHPHLRDVPAEGFAVIDVDTHVLAAGLSGTEPTSRLAAMFSIPYVVAVALREGQITPAEHSAERLHDPEVAALAARVRVHNDEVLSARLPAERVARVRIELTDGSEYEHEVPNPIGDSDYAPLDAPALHAKGDRLIDPALVERVWTFAEQLTSSSSSVRELSELLRWPAAETMSKEKE